MVGQFIRLFCRYIGAIGVACVASFAVILGAQLLDLSKMSDSNAMLALIITLVLVGFFGVFLGAFCLPRSHRRFGAFVLMLLGLSFYTLLLLHDYVQNPYLTDMGKLIWGMPLAGGGLAAALTVCFWRRRPNNVPEATAG